jgi:hypothetical protein
MKFSTIKVKIPVSRERYMYFLKEYPVAGSFEVHFNSRKQKKKSHKNLFGERNLFYGISFSVF